MRYELYLIEATDDNHKETKISESDDLEALKGEGQEMASIMNPDALGWTYLKTENPWRYFLHVSESAQLIITRI